MWLSLLLALIGLFFIYLEFFLPGGILAVIGGIVMVISLVLAYFNLSSIWMALGYTLALFVLIYGVCRYALHRIKCSAATDSFYLKQDQEGYTAASYDSSLIGKKGVAFSDLKPSGHVMIEGASYQALSERGYISKGTEIEVVGGRASYLLVKCL